MNCTNLSDAERRIVSVLVNHHRRAPGCTTPAGVICRPDNLQYWSAACILDALKAELPAVTAAAQPSVQTILDKIVATN